MRALITNDDGIMSPGIAALARAVRDAGHDILVAAPTWDSSGASASLTEVEDHGRFLYDECPVDGLAGEQTLGVEGAPAFIVRAAATGAFGDPPDVVVSGINRGLNTGYAVLHSGTVGAVLTGTTFGISGVAVSIEAGTSPAWHTAGAVAATVLPWLLGQEAPVALNVNVPDVEPDKLEGIQPAALASIGAVQVTVTEVGRGWVQLSYAEPDDEHEPGTDAALVTQRIAAVTPLMSVCEATGVDVSTVPASL